MGPVEYKELAGMVWCDVSQSYLYCYQIFRSMLDFYSLYNHQYNTIQYINAHSSPWSDRRAGEPSDSRIRHGSWYHEQLGLWNVRVICGMHLHACLFNFCVPFFLLLFITWPEVYYYSSTQSENMFVRILWLKVAIFLSLFAS